jgi:hypothetical protein
VLNYQAWLFPFNYLLFYFTVEQMGYFNAVVDWWLKIKADVSYHVEADGVLSSLVHVRI